MANTWWSKSGQGPGNPSSTTTTDGPHVRLSGWVGQVVTP